MKWSTKSTTVCKSEWQNKKMGNGRHAWIYFLLPSMLGVSIFVLLPFADVIRRSTLTAVSRQFVGWKNYVTVFQNKAFLLAVANTVRFVLVCLPLLMFLSLLIAMILSSLPQMQFIKSMYLLPLAVPTATVVFIWKLYFEKEGLLNAFFSQHGLQTLDFMGSDAAFGVLVFSYIWKNLGYTVILWLAGIMSVPDSVVEAARVDGATEWQCFLRVIFPNLKLTLYTITVLSFLNSFKVFREAYLVAGSYPHDSIYLLQHLFNNWFANLEMDKMAAAAVVIACILFLLILVMQFFWDNEEVRNDEA